MKLKYVDADSHIVEIGGTWERYIEGKFASRRPRVIDHPDPGPRPERNKTWFLDGLIQPRHRGAGGVLMSTPGEMEFARRRDVDPEVQGFSAVAKRAEYMNRASVERSMLYSTFFLQPPVEELDYEEALARAWNRWMADRCAENPEMFRFAAVVPMRDPYIAEQVLREAKELGSNTAMILPTAGRRMLDDEHLDPFWSAAQELDMRVAIHIGWGDPGLTRKLLNVADLYLGIEVFMWNAYVSMLAGNMFDRYPNLKIAFVEHEPRWLEVFMHRAEQWYESHTASPWPGTKSPHDVLRDHDIYFTYEGEPDYLPKFLEVAGEDRVMAALDFPHTHYDGAAMSSSLEEIVASSLSDEQKQRVLRDNACRFYGWTDLQ